MTRLVSVIATCLLVSGIFGCATVGEVQRLRQELAAAQKSCDRIFERTDEALVDAGQRTVDLERRLYTLLMQANCHKCDNPPDTPECAQYCVMDLHKGWDNNRLQPSTKDCERLKGVRTTLSNAQDIWACLQDEIDRQIADADRRREEQQKR